jgi:hypothetical protein
MVRSVDMARVLLGSMTLAQVLVGCSEPAEPDWCTERQDETAIPANGRLQVDYRGHFATGPVEIEPFVTNEPKTALVAKGCATDRQGTLWRFHGGWVMPEQASFPLDVERQPTEQATFLGRLSVCPHGACVERETEIVGGVFPNGLGTISAYDPAAGSFAGTIRMVNALDEEINVEADLQWTTPAR